MLASIKRAPNPGELVYSNNYVEIDSASCIECGECVEVCEANQVAAILNELEVWLAQGQISALL